MRNLAIVALATSGTLVTAYHVVDPPPELGITPEMFNWGSGWLGWAFGFVVSVLILAVIIGTLVQVARWLIRLGHLT